MKWNLPVQNTSKGDVVDRILQLRGITAEQRDKFLNPSTQDIDSARNIYNSVAAAKHILDAVKAKQRIFIHGDYDVDGVCATAILWDFLFRELKADVMPFIPSRFDDGYGLTENSITAMIDQGAQVVITVDCGVKDLELVRKYTDQGIKFIITDHHALAEQNGAKVVSDATLAVVHPAYPEHELNFKEICGATVAWKLACVIAQEAKLDTDMDEYLDLVALATVCDVMPLVGENRALVALGLIKLQSSNRVGLQELAQVGEFDLANVQAYHLGFNIGPRLNAAGRMESALDALRLLTTISPAKAAQMAHKLNSLNLERQQVTQKLLQLAEEMIAGFPPDQKLYVIHGENWPEGVIGLVAGKLTEKYHRPVLVGTNLGEEVKFSARSISAFHITEAIAKFANLVERFGGHAQAAGASLHPDKLAEFTQNLVQAADVLTDEDLQPDLKIDLIAQAAEFDLDTVKLLEMLEPHGFGNARPVIAIQNAKVREVRKFGKAQNHIRLVLEQEGHIFEVVKFNFPNEFQIAPGDVIDVAVNVSINTWNGQDSVQFIYKDHQKPNDSRSGGKSS